MPALVTLDNNSLEVIETTRLLHGSTLTSHLRVMYDAAVNVADLRKREYHNSIVTLTALEEFAVERDIMGQQCLLKWSLPRGRISCASHNHTVQSFLLRPLGSGSPLCLQRGMFTKAQ